MTMKTILVPFHGNDTAQSALELAYLIAERFGSYIEGLFVRQPPPIIAGEGITIPGEYLTQLAEEGRRVALRAPTNVSTRSWSKRESRSRR